MENMKKRNTYVLWLDSLPLFCVPFCDVFSLFGPRLATWPLQSTGWRPVISTKSRAGPIWGGSITVLNPCLRYCRRATILKPCLNAKIAYMHPHDCNYLSKHILFRNIWVFRHCFVEFYHMFWIGPQGSHYKTQSKGSRLVKASTKDQLKVF